MNISSIRNQIVQLQKTETKEQKVGEPNDQQNILDFDVTKPPATIVRNSSIWLSPSQQDSFAQLQADLAQEAQQNPGFYPRLNNAEFSYETQLESYLNILGVSAVEIESVIEQRQVQMQDPQFLQSIRDQVSADFEPADRSDFPTPGHSYAITQLSIDLDAFNQNKFEVALQSALNPSFVPQRGQNADYSSELRGFLSEIGVSSTEIDRILQQRQASQQVT